jgi:Protein of unknown function (DUF1479)
MLPLRAAIPNNSSSLGKKYEMEQTNSERPPRLDDRFAVLKGEIIKPQDERAVTASYQRLKDALATEADRIDREQQSAFPEVEWSDVVNNGYTPLTYTRFGIHLDANNSSGNAIAAHIAAKARSAGCVIFRNVIPAEQALA